LMILGMIYSTIYWRKVSLKSIKQTRYQWQFLIIIPSIINLSEIVTDTVSVL
jgi:hypothetical protein